MQAVSARRGAAGLPARPHPTTLGGVSEQMVELDLDDEGVATELPRPEHQRDEVQQVPYRPVQFRDDDLPSALERAARWLRTAQEWLGEPLDVIAVHLDYDDRAGSPYYEVKLLCNEEDLAGGPLAARRARQADDAAPA
jgi:endonuclease/exonuclease/phosphatase family metal-dependent hydrolase